MLNSGRIYPKKNVKLNEFKKSIVKDINDNLNEYQAFQMKNNNSSEYILLKKNSIQYNLLTKILKINKEVDVNDLNCTETNNTLRI